MHVVYLLPRLDWAISLGQHPYVAEANLAQLEPRLFKDTTTTYPAYVTAPSFSHLSKYFNIVIANFSTAFHSGPRAFAGTPDAAPRTLGL